MRKALPQTPTADSFRYSLVAVPPANAFKSSAVPVGQPRWPAGGCFNRSGLVVLRDSANAHRGTSMATPRIGFDAHDRSATDEPGRRARVELSARLIRPGRYYCGRRFFARINSRAAAGPQ